MENSTHTESIFERFFKKELVVYRDGKYDIKNNNGDIISDEWEWDCCSLQKGSPLLNVRKSDESSNFVNCEGEYFSPRWFEDSHSIFSEGWTAVKLDGKWNFINYDREYLSDQWWDDCCPFSFGLAAVKKDDKWNYINKKLQFLCDEWFDEAYGFDKLTDDGLVFDIVKRDGKYNLINTRGELIFDIWYDDFQQVDYKKDEHDIGSFFMIRLKKDDKYNFVNENLQIISDVWFDDADDTFYDGLCEVWLDWECYMLDINGILHPCEEEP